MYSRAENKIIKIEKQKIIWTFRLCRRAIRTHSFPFEKGVQMKIWRFNGIESRYAIRISEADSTIVKYQNFILVLSE